MCSAKTVRCHVNFVVGRSVLGIHLLPFLALFQRLFVFPNPIGFAVNHCSWDSHLHCHPETPIICRSGYILIYEHEYLSPTRLSMKISVANSSVSRKVMSGIKYQQLKTVCWKLLKKYFSPPPNPFFLYIILRNKYRNLKQDKKSASLHSQHSKGVSSAQVI